MSKRIDAILRTPEPVFVARIEELVRKAVNLVSDGQDGSAVVAEINRLTGRSYTDRDFFELWGWTSEEEFALAAASAVSEPIDDLTRDEIKEILGYFHRGKEPQSTVLIDFMERTYGAGFDTDLIYWPKREMDDDGLIDEIYRRAGRVAPLR